MQESSYVSIRDEKKITLGTSVSVEDKGRRSSHGIIAEESDFAENLDQEFKTLDARVSQKNMF